MVDKKELKTITPLISQMCLRNLGMYASSYLANDIYFLLESIHLLIPDIGEEFIKKKFEEQGKDWDEMKKRLDKLNKLILRTKTFYDPIEEKSFKKIAKKNPVDRILQRFFIKTASKVALMQRELYDLFVSLIKMSTLQRNQIPNEAFKVLEHRGFRKIELGKKPSSGTPQPEVVAEGG